MSSPPGAGGPGADPDDPKQQWMGRMGIDARWEHTILVVNAAGDIIEQWTQWDKMMRRPHAVYVNPWDPQKHDTPPLRRVFDMTLAWFAAHLG